MKKNDKRTVIFGIVKYVLTFFPLATLLLVLALSPNIKQDYTIYNASDENVFSAHITDEFIFLYDNANKVEYNGLVTYHEGLKRYGIYITEDTILKINNKYYTYTLDEETTFHNMVDITKKEVTKKQGNNFTVVFFLSVLSTGIVLWVILAKMEWLKAHKKLSVLFSLTLGTIILFILDAIIGSMLYVFAAATLGWAMHMLVEFIESGKGDKDKEKEANEVLRDLKRLSERL